MDDEQQRSRLVVERAIVDLHRRLLDPRLDEERRGELLLQLEELESEEDRLAVGQPVPSLSQTSTTFLALDALRAGLASDEAVLAFQTGRWQSIEGRFDGGSWLLVVTTAGARLHRMPDPAILAVGADLWVDLFRRRDGSEEGPAAALHESLLTAALDELPQGVTRLIVIPDGPLHRLPFPALLDARRGTPLAARYEISQVPSATAWWRLRERSSGTPRALALVDPILPAVEPSVNPGFAERSWTEGLTLAPLPYARREGRSAIRRLGLPGDLLLGAEASERVVKATAPNLRLLHVGAHSVFDETHPQRSDLGATRSHL